MNTQEDYRPVASCMARISWKTLLYALFLTFANILV